MPVAWYGSEEQKERFLRAATSDPSGEYLGGWTASEPPGNPSGTANFDIPLPRPAGVGLTATRDGDHYVLNGRKYWPSSAGWDEQGVNAQTVIVRTDPEAGGTEGLSAIVVERGTPGVTYKYTDKEGHRLTSNAAVGVARAAYEKALDFASNNTAGTLKPIIHFQNVGYLLATSHRRSRWAGTSPGAPRTTWTSTTSTPNSWAR
nr:acyl-CoA dehydrogenase family protein [Pseudonocardia bannensis]